MDADVLPEAELRAKAKDVKALFRGLHNRETSESLDVDALDQHTVLLARLFATAECQQLAATHRAAACNALCAYLEQGFACSTARLRDNTLSLATWTRLLGLYLERIQDPGSKPMKQTLDALRKGLAASLQWDPKDQEKTKFALSRCLAYIVPHDDIACVKPAMNVLVMLLSKGFTSLKQLDVAVDGIDMLHVTTDETSSDHPSVHILMTHALRWAQFVDVAPVAGKLLSVLLRTLRESSLGAPGVKVTGMASGGWVDALLRFAQDDPSRLEILERYILPPILQADEDDTAKFLQGLAYRELIDGSFFHVPEEQARLCLLTVKVILQSMPKILTALGTAVEESPSRLQGKSLLPYQSMAIKLLSHSSSSLRIAAFGLLVYARSPTTSFSEVVLSELLQALPLLCLDADARVRTEYLGFFQRLCVRLHSVVQQCRRHANVEAPDPIPTFSQLQEQSPDVDWKQTLNVHAKFGKACLRILLRELDPSCSYPRHILALQCLKLALQHDFHRITEVDLHSSQVAEILLDLVLDAYDDVRCLAATLLHSLKPQIASGSGSVYDCRQSSSHTDALQHAEALTAKTGRASHGDGLGRLYDLHFAGALPFVTDQIDQSAQIDQLVRLLESDVCQAKGSLTAAVAATPLPAHFIALRYLVSRPDLSLAFSKVDEEELNLPILFRCRLIGCCQSTWEFVKGVLCIDSPEGQHDDTEDLDASESVEIGSKDTLSFCWRSLKESSSLMNALLASEGQSTRQGRLALSSDDLKTIGDLSFLQLNELRHRGAFSTVSTTFLNCCCTCMKSADEEASKLPELWFKAATQSIFEKAHALTRRSAGLPSIVVGILTAYPQGSFFESAMTQLLDIGMLPVEQPQGGGPLELPQVHALNCLKDTFSSSKLSRKTETYLEQTLDVAVQCLACDTWAVRNCGLMLFRALLTRLCGGTNISHEKAVESRRRFARSTYNRYPRLAQTVIRLLQLGTTHGEHSGPEDHTRAIEMVYPALEIIDKVGVAIADSTSIKQMLYSLLSSKVWRLREKAAASLSLLLEPQDLLEKLLSQPGSAATPSSANALHGMLTCLELICTRSNFHQDGISPTIRDFEKC